MNNLPDNVLEQIKQLHLADRLASIKSGMGLSYFSISNIKQKAG